MSQSADILNHLKRKPITPLEALAHYGCFRLAARVADLRRAGHQINTETVKKDGKIFARYRLIKRKG
jgi:hypothetical protein